MKTKAILFDLDGTLRDTKDIIVEAYQHAVEVHKGLSAHIDYDLWLETYRTRLNTAWMDAPFFEHAEAVLQELAMAGYRLAVVTSAEYKRTIEYLSYRGIDQYFEVVVAMRDGFRPKPAPDMMLEALRQLDCAPEETVAIGDMITDVQAAHAAGIKCIGITHGFASREELEAAGAEAIIDSLAGFLGHIEQMK